MENLRMYIKLMKNRKARIGGMEINFIVLLVLGLIVAFSINNIIINYLIVTVSGLGLGFLLYRKQYEMRARYVLMGLSFIIGYIIGVRGSIRLRLGIIFLISIIFGYVIYKLFIKSKNITPEEEI